MPREINHERRRFTSLRDHDFAEASTRCSTLSMPIKRGLGTLLTSWNNWAIARHSRGDRNQKR
jgi:hypothetical protein